MKNLILALLVSITPLYALANETQQVVHIQDKNKTWDITVVNCDIDPEKEVVVVKRGPFPNERITIKQDGKVQRCEVIRINVLIA